MVNFLMIFAGIMGVSLIVLMLGSGAKNLTTMTERLGWLVLSTVAALVVASFLV